MFPSAVAAMLLLGWSESVFGQAADRQVVDIVFAQLGVLIAACAVVAENVDTGVLGSQRTDELGAYRFSSLPVGRYTLAAQSESLAPAVRQGSR